MARFLQSMAVSALIVLAFTAFSIAVVAPHLPPVAGRPDRSVVKPLEADAAKLLRIHQSDGSVRIRTHSGPGIRGSVTLRAYARRGTDPAALDQYLSKLVAVERQDDALDVTTESLDRPYGFLLYADYSVLIPEGASVGVESANGDVAVSGKVGGVSIRGLNASIEVDRPGGEVLAETVNGRIRVIDAPAGANLTAVNGNIYAHILGGTLRAETINGVIVARMLDPAVKGAELKTRNGGITLVMKDGCAGRVDAIAENGNVRSDFPLDTAGMPELNGQLHGFIGKGDTSINMESTNGNLWIARDSS